MSLFSFLFKRAPALPATLRGPGAEQPSQKFLQHRDLLRMAFRDMLGLTGIPPGWMSLKVSPAGASTGDVNALIVLHEWDARIAQSAPEVERLVRLRLRANGAASDDWFVAVRWTFEVHPGAVVPALPPAFTWGPEADDDCPPGWLQTEAAPDSIQGPDVTDSMREDLEVLQHARRAEAARHQGQGARAVDAG